MLLLLFCCAWTQTISHPNWTHHPNLGGFHLPNDRAQIHVRLSGITLTACVSCFLGCHHWMRSGYGERPLQMVAGPPVFRRTSFPTDRIALVSCRSWGGWQSLFVSFRIRQGLSPCDWLDFLDFRQRFCGFQSRMCPGTAHPICLHSELIYMRCQFAAETFACFQNLCGERQKEPRLGRVFVGLNLTLKSSFATVQPRENLNHSTTNEISTKWPSMRPKDELDETEKYSFFLRLKSGLFGIVLRILHNYIEGFIGQANSVMERELCESINNKALSWLATN